ncbi:hypothetical protein L2E82_49332 [Cichorium intybus]|uniref:Uncharacterized protein n=1 Tax=Cichorium intybus TaxID=13427 RepID=A0ACB8Z0D5_CICIN|nr:hypothetical protein L2E82_49332 [Cichorium intybus]
MEATSSSSKSRLGGLYTAELLQPLYTCDLLAMEALDMNNMKAEFEKIQDEVGLLNKKMKVYQCALLMTVMGFINNWISFVYAYGV